ncbi:MAG: methyltransferase, TrmA family [Caulobacteraceae bacterium]|nr:methyltransferase, TrmA family [Caulobacteraceae bacterium]
MPKSKLAGPVEADVIRIGGQGDGVCQTASGHSVFTPFTLPGEAVRIEAQGERGELLEVLAASPERIEPVCPHFFACGGCALQHWDHAPYLAWKQERVREALSREGLHPQMAPPFAAAPGSRRRVALHARRGDRAGDRVRLGYKERRSWSLVEIEVCPIAHPRLVAAFPALRALAAPFLEHPKSAPTLHVTLTGTGLDIDVTGVERKSGGLSADARLRAAEIAAKADFARVTMAGEVVYMARQPMVRLGPAVVALPPGGFLQAVPEAEDAMAEFAVEAMRGAHRIADLFCGSGAFTFRLAALAPVLAVDSDPLAIRSLIAATASAPGLKSITAEARDLFRRPMLAQDLKKTDAVLFDPPRAGADMQAAQIAASKVSTVVGVSCDPGTFARDAAILAAGGLRLEQVMVVDQFLWSPHVELVGVFKR